MSVAATHEIARDLHSLLREIEPARWKAENMERIRVRFDELSQRLTTVLEEWEGAAETLREVASELETTLRGLPETDVREKWMTFREHVGPLYSALADSLKACHLEVPDLRPTNYLRSFAHVASGLFALALVEFLPFAWVEIIAIGFAIGCWTLETTRRISDEWNARLMKLFGPIAHPHETYRVNSSTWYATALVVLVAIGSPLICAIAVMVLACCDPIAATVGRRWGKHELVNNRSLEGTLAFFLAGIFVCAATMWAFHSAEVTALQFWLVAIVAAGSGAITELFSRRIDDNFAIPVGVAVAAWLVLQLPLTG